MSKKHNLVLYVDEELVEKPRESGLNLKKALDNCASTLPTRTYNNGEIFNKDHAILGPSRALCEDYCKSNNESQKR
jgi:hypothetical protein